MSFTLEQFREVFARYEEENPAGEYDSGDEHFFHEGGTLQFGRFTPYDSDPSNYWDEGDCWYVIKHDESGRLFLRTGEYSSYDGYEWNEPIREVTKGVEKVRFEAYFDAESGKQALRAKEIKA